MSEENKVLLLSEETEAKLQRQRQTHDCGVAATAMFLNKPYDEIRAAFENLGFDTQRKNKHPYASNFKDLFAVLNHFGVSPKKRRFLSYTQLPDNAILKVNKNEKGDWHWVTFQRINELSLVLDPALPLIISAENAECWHIYPTGCFIF